MPPPVRLCCTIRSRFRGSLAHSGRHGLCGGGAPSNVKKGLGFPGRGEPTPSLCSRWKRQGPLPLTWPCRAPSHTPSSYSTLQQPAQPLSPSPPHGADPPLAGAVHRQRGPAPEPQTEGGNWRSCNTRNSRGLPKQRQARLDLRTSLRRAVLGCVCVCVSQAAPGDEGGSARSLPLLGEPGEASPSGHVQGPWEARPLSHASPVREASLRSVPELTLAPTREECPSLYGDFGRHLDSLDPLGVSGVTKGLMGSSPHGGLISDGRDGKPPRGHSKGLCSPEA